MVPRDESTLAMARGRASWTWALLVAPPRENTVVNANTELTYEDVVTRDYMYSANVASSY